MRSKKTTGLRELLRGVELLSKRRLRESRLEKPVALVLGPLAREVSVYRNSVGEVLVLSCRSASAREKAQALESLLLDELSQIEDISIRRVEYRIDPNAGRAHVPERLTAQLHSITEEQKTQITEVSSRLKDDKLRESFQGWMTVVAQLEQAERKKHSAPVGDADLDTDR